MSKSNNTNRQIVIIGGGIIGCTTAYYLTHHPSFNPTTASITIIEASVHGAAQGASGKAGGLVAKWAYPRELAQLSFEEHERLAQRYGGEERWGWRYVQCGSWTGRAGVGGLGVEVEGDGGTKKGTQRTEGQGRKEKKKAKSLLPPDLTWVREGMTDEYEPIDSGRSTAQVHPYLFTTSMLALATSKGAHFLSGTARSINIDRVRCVVSGVTYSPSAPKPESVSQADTLITIPATHVILCAGPWSPTLLPTLPISADRAHSITFRPSTATATPPHVLFAALTHPPASTPSTTTTTQIEIYPRPHEIYASGPTDTIPLPPSVDTVPIDETACELIRVCVAELSYPWFGGAEAAEVEKRQACLLPVVSAGAGEGPIVGEARGVAGGMIVGAGHTCWGISNAPGTARAICEIVMEGKVRCAELGKLDPGRFV